ncbi:hypothetical protein Roomu2_00082 [Pseudomonas phage vB_PpuM-Roomu-2]|uniref:Uncharacterized protein n=1 Tax=Pseudomonas phage vB_PpuM-Roomu-2 TaxID=3132621 RepID=A0AAX4MYI6_9CAUD
MSKFDFQLSQKFSVTCRNRGETMAARECLRNLGYAIFYSFASDSVEEMEAGLVSYDLEDVFRGSTNEDLHFATLGDMLAYHYDNKNAEKLRRIKELKEELAQLEASL